MKAIWMAMTPKSENNKLSFSTTQEIRVPRSELTIGIFSSDWQRLKKRISNLSSGSRWIERVFDIFFAAALTLITALPSIPKSSVYWLYYALATVFFGTGALFSFIGIILFKSTDGDTKSNIVQEMNDIEEKCSTEQVDDKPEKFRVENKQSVLELESIHGKEFMSSNRNQGIDKMQIPVGKSRLLAITAVFSSKSSYWRAGIKLLSQNAEHTDNPLGEYTALFHIGVKNGKCELIIYTDGKFENRRVKELTYIDVSKPITLILERNEKNFVQCFINDTPQFSERMSPELFSKAEFMTWGDGHPYKVNLEMISFDVQ